ncbi:uncharacterized protein LOC119652951 [Hermetia illucens]|nr:uncharacterized protein LOC119652951 [Hermetia illucens]
MNSITGCIFSGIHFKTLQPLAGYFPLINANTIPNRMLENLLRIICIICFGASLGVFADIRVIDDGERAGCFHDGTLFANGSMVPTMEPCLSCRCNINTLICSLRVCPEMPVPPPRGCILVQKKSGCCPYLSCKKYHTPYDGQNRRIVAYLDHYERETIDRVVNDNVLQRRSDDSDLDGTGEICIVNGTVYKSGSAMGSSSLCSYCYCIGGIQKCVKPKCMLNMDGCKPIFVDSTCCPVRYDCSSRNSGIVKASRFQIRSGNKHYLRVIGRTQRNRGCIINSTFYHEGQKLPTDPERHCDICFCIRGSRKCAPKKCAPPLKNCIPVVPKGQCCPSSYDCNNTREPGRQFDLFSLLFGPENNASTTDVSPTTVAFSSNGIKTSTEKTFFDAIREGLEYIDNSESTVADVLKQLNIINDTTTSTSTSTTETALLDKLDQEEDEDLGLFDILLGKTKEKDSEKSNSTEDYDEEGNADGEEVNSTEVTDTGNDKSGDNLLEKQVNNPEVITNKDTGNNTEEQKVEGGTKMEVTEDDLVDEDKVTVSIMSITDDDPTTDNPPSTIEYANEESDEYLYSTTAEEEDSTEFVDEEDNDVHEEEQIVTTTEPNTTEASSIQQDEQHTSTEVIASTEVESKNNGLDIRASTLPSIGNATEEEMNTELPPSTSALNNDHKDQTTETNGGDFFSALFNGLTKILEPTNNKTVSVGIVNKTNNDANDENVDAISESTPNGKSTSSTESSITVSPPVMEVTTEKPIPVSPPSINILTPMPTERTVIIKTNPSILEADYNFDYSEPTLPPSLPNLKIIPFLPTDAVKNDRKQMNYDYYGKLKPTPGYPSITEKHDNWGHPAGTGPKNSIAKIDYDVGYDHTVSYPSITEPYDENSSDRHKYEFSSFEYSDTSLEEMKNKFESPVAAEPYDFMKTEAPPTVNRFSPPAKTEGGFVPKDPMPEQFYYDTFHTTKFLIDLTTSAPNVLTTVNVSKTAITTPDPFKDVIKTEPPPDLSSLIVDKEKLLANGPQASKESEDDADFEKEIISITTDATYNFTSEYKDAKDDLVNDSNFMVNFYELSNVNISTSTVHPAVMQSNATNPIPPFSPVMSNTKTKLNTTENNYSFVAGLDSVLDLFFKDEGKNMSYEGITIPPFRTLPPANTKYELIKTYSPGSTHGDLDSSDSVEDLSILKDALFTGYEPKDSESYKVHSKVETSTEAKKPEDVPANDMPAFLAEPFNKLPFIKPSFPVKPPKEYHYNPMNSDLDLMLPSPGDTEMKTHFNVEGYKVISNDPTIAQTDSYVVNPVDINKLKQHQSGGGAQVFTKPDASNSINDPAGILKLAGCNIYGRMYRVGRIISELSGPCLECKCTEVGVNCTPLSC